MTFNVGDRVIYNADGDKGTITRFERDKIWISWDEAKEAEAWASEHEISKFGSYGSDALENFAKTAAKFANDPISTEDAEKLKTLSEQLGISPFEQSVRYHTNKIADILIVKNKQYSNSALDPIRVFSKSDRQEQLRVRADDKLSRIRNGDTSEDAITDLCGYLILMKIAEESE